MKFLVTGGGRGIGLEIINFALEAGHEVLTIVRDPHRASALNQAKKEYGEKLRILKGDVSSLEDLHRLKEEVGEDEIIDVVVNNAGIMTDSDDDFKRLDPEDLLLTFQINAFAPLWVAQIFLANLKKSPQPKLINITSKMGSITDNQSGGYYAYRMSKTALNMFTKGFSVDHPNIIALTLHPGWVKTQMGGPEAPTLPRESARGLFKVIQEATKDHSGRFLDFKGQEIPW